MNMNNTWLRIALVTGIAVVLAAPSFTQNQGPGAGQGQGGQRQGRMGNAAGPEALVAPPGDILRLGQELNLTDAQKTTIKGIADAKMAAIKPLVEQIPALHKKVADQMLSSKPDATIVKAALASASQIRAQIAEIGVDFWVAVRGALTDDQNVKLTETLKARQQRGMGRVGGMGNANRQGGPNGSAPGDGQRPPPPGGDAPEADPGQ